MKRNTLQREAIQSVFKYTDAPLKIEEILILGRKIVPSLNQATVYRNLKYLVETGIIRKIMHPALGAVYELAGKKHHHHFHCRICDQIFDIPGCSLKEAEAAPPGFLTEGHEIFLFGICAECREM